VASVQRVASASGEALLVALRLLDMVSKVSDHGLQSGVTVLQR